MAAWKTLGSLVVLLGLGASAHGQTYALKEAPLKDAYFRTQITMSLAGELKVVENDKTQSIKQKAGATHEFLERVLDAEDAAARKVLRSYTKAEAVIGEGEQTSRRELRRDRALVVAQRTKEGPVAFSPQGALTREEVELTEHFDTLHLAGLLPGKEVAVGDGWKVTNGPAQALCAFDGLTAQDLACKLEEVKDDVARVSVTGTASGIALGAAVSLKIDASYRFDLRQKRVVAVDWKQHDARDLGPVSPALAFDVTISLKRTPLEEATELNDLVLARVPTEQTPPEAMTAVRFADPARRFELTHAREWHLVGRTDEHAVLRLLDRGDFVAQATLTWWKKAEAGKHMSADDFKEAMSESPGWEQDSVVDEKEVADMPKGYWAYRLHALGKLNGLESVQYFYLVAGPQGDQMVVSFTMTPNQAQKLEARDLALVRSLVYPVASRPPAEAKAP